MTGFLSNMQVQCKKFWRIPSIKHLKRYMIWKYWIEILKCGYSSPTQKFISNKIGLKPNHNDKEEVQGSGNDVLILLSGLGTRSFTFLINDLSKTLKLGYIRGSRTGRRFENVKALQVCILK